MLDLSANREGGNLVLVHVPMSAYDEKGDGVLIKRETAARARFEIERQVAAAGPDAPVALDFDRVRAISVPFADECVGGLLSGRLAGGYYDEDHPIVAINASEDVRETLALTLAHRRLSLLL